MEAKNKRKLVANILKVTRQDDWAKSFLTQNTKIKNRFFMQKEVFSCKRKAKKSN